MDFELNDTQVMFRNMARDFTAREVEPVAMEYDQKGDPKEAVAFDLIRKGFDQDFHKMIVPVELGGLGLDAVTSVLMLENLDALSHKTKMGVVYLTASSSEVLLEQSFHNRSVMDEFQGEISGLTDVCLSDPIVGISQSLKAEVNDPATKSRLERVVPLREGEHYLACIALSGLVLTNQRVVGNKYSKSM